MNAILKHLRVHIIDEVSDSGNLIIAYANTGSLKHVQNINDIDCPNLEKNQEFGSEIDQAVQVSGTAIDKEMQTLAKAFAPTLVQIPPLMENPEPTMVENNKTKPKGVFFNQEAFKNFSNITVPENVAVILSMGPRFSVPVYYRSEDFAILKETAIMINDMFGNPIEQQKIRENIIDHVKQYREEEHVQHATTIRDYFHQALIDTKKFCKNHPDIIVTQADKANCTIIMDRKVYNDKVENLLRDTTTYTNLRNTSTPAYILMNKKILDRMVKAQMITEQKAENAITKETRTANMYALIKTHKEGEPPRPIVNTRGSMGFAAAETIAKILNNAREKYKYNVINSQQVIHRINDIQVCPDEHFFSLDIVSMFTNIPVQEAIRAVKKRQKTLQLNDEKMKIIIDVIQFVCVISTEIVFNEKTFKQIKGLRMGSSLSPILADFVVEDMLDRAFMTIERPILIMKYVDDIMLVSTEDKAHNLMEKLNEFNSTIKFEMEKETNNHINYLDITIINQPFNLQTKWYQKHIASGRFLNFLSHHTKSNIINTAISFVHTMITNTSPEHMKETITKAKHLLRINSYPTHEADRIITIAEEKAKKQQTNTNSNTNTSKDSTLYGKSLPYIPKLTEKIAEEITHGRDPNESPRKTPSKPMYKLSQQVFNPSKHSTPKDDEYPRPGPMKIAITDTLDLTQN